MVGRDKRKWIKSNTQSHWNKMFTSFEEYDAMITKLMLYECVAFTDELLLSNVFKAQNIALRSETMLLAKMQFYHLVTKSATVHNLFYGYAEELWRNHYREDLETTHSILSNMHQKEKWYLWWYYDGYEDSKGDLKKVLKEYLNSVEKNSTTDGVSVLNVSKDDLHYSVALGLSKMHERFLNKVVGLNGGYNGIF